jgi:hypothetical protein
MIAPTKAGAKKNVAFGRVDELMVIVHNRLPPSDEEWSAWLDFNIRNFAPGAMLKCLVVTEGGAPTATQRLQMTEKLNEHLAGNPKAFRGAIVTASAFVRGVVTALSWFHPGYCAFSPAHMGDALTYLEIKEQFHAEVTTLVKTLQGQIPNEVDGKRVVKTR